MIGENILIQVSKNVVQAVVVVVKSRELGHIHRRLAPVEKHHVNDIVEIQNY